MVKDRRGPFDLGRSINSYTSTPKYRAPQDETYINIVCGTYWNMFLKVEILSVPDWTMTRLIDDNVKYKYSIYIIYIYVYIITKAIWRPSDSFRGPSNCAPWGWDTYLYIATVFLAIYWLLSGTALSSNFLVVVKMDSRTGFFASQNIISFLGLPSDHGGIN